jgi:hypothetical protein
LAIRDGVGPSSWPKLSDSEWAGSVEMTRVLWPASALARAVAAATEVFPTPPLPVKSRTRTRRRYWSTGAPLSPGASLPPLGVPPSTRVLSSESAVLMMRASARRFTKPGMGTMRSTASS